MCKKNSVQIEKMNVRLHKEREKRKKLSLGMKRLHTHFGIEGCSPEGSDAEASDMEAPLRISSTDDEDDEDDEEDEDEDEGSSDDGDE